MGQALQAQLEAVESLIDRAGLEKSDFLPVNVPDSLPSSIVEINRTVLVAQSQNGSSFIRVVKKFLRIGGSNGRAGSEEG